MKNKSPESNVPSPESSAPHPFNYFVSYCFAEQGTGAQGSGSTQLSLDQPIRSYADIARMTEYLEERNSFKQVCILNWIPFETDPSDQSAPSEAFTLSHGRGLNNINGLRFLDAEGDTIFTHPCEAARADFIALKLGKQLSHS